MKKLLAGVLACMGASAALIAPADAAPPKLMIVIAVDQLSADLFDEYRPHFTGGLARLATGTVFRNGYQSHATTETCPGHAAILTGARPSRSGITANAWYDPKAPRADKEVYCAENESAPPSSDDYAVSAVHLRVPTLGDVLHKASPQSRVIAISGKDREGVMLSGMAPDQRWYWRKTGFTSDLPSATEPKTVSALNRAVLASIAQPLDALDPPSLCAAKARPIEIGKGKVVGNGAFARAAGDVRAFEASPEYDGAILALASGVGTEMGLGKGSATDLMIIGLSATDYVGHTYGTQGQEMCLQLMSLDRDLGDYLDRLDQAKLDYAVMLTSDHGSLDIPERVDGGQWADAALDAKAVGKAIGTSLGLQGDTLIGDSSGWIYFADGLSAANRAKVERAALDAYRKHPQVEAVFTRAEIEATPATSKAPDKWSLIERVRVSYDRERSGDLFVVLKPKVQPYTRESGRAGSHGSPWDYDRRVPIVFYRPQQVGTTFDTAVETVDIMPTLAAQLGLAIDTTTVDGKCLPGITGIPCPTK